MGARPPARNDLAAGDTTDAATNDPSGPAFSPVQLLPSAPAQVSHGDANAMTPVSPSTTVTPEHAGLARSEAIASMVSAANHAVIQRVASGNIEVPELGRVAVRAATVGARVDIDVSSDRPETRAILHASAGAMVADLRQADVPVRHLRFNEADAGSTPSNARQHDTTGRETPRGQHENKGAEGEEQAREAAPQRSVRIVL